jgi:hypothetical protein
MKTKLHLSPFSNNHVSKSFFRPALMTAVVLLLALGGVKLLAPFSSSAKQNRQNGSGQQGSQCLKCPAPTQQIIYAPIIDLPEASSSEINLNCRSSHPMDVTPTFYKADGTPIVGEVIHLQPADILFVDTSSLIPAEYRQQRDWGGMSLSYTGQYREVWAQITLHGINRGDSVNVLFSVLNDARSNSQGAVWWMPRNGEATIALGNGSGERIQATLEFSDGATRDVNLDPFATEIVTRHANQRGGRPALNGKSESVIINSMGPAGSLIASGIVGSADGKFTGSIRFYDTQKAVQSNLYSTRFRLKNVAPRVLLRNTTTGSIVARPRFLPESAGNPVELPAMKLGPDETAEVNLAPLMAAVEERSDLDAASVQIINDGAPGSLIGALYGTDKTTGMVYDVPLRDSGPVRRSTGGYPVRLDGDYSTIISITNASEVPAEFTAQVNYEGGPYLLSKHKLAAGETMTFDFRKLRDEQIPDWKGHILPASFMRGQFRWGIHGGGANARLTGRAEILSLSESVSSSYSCEEICPPSFDYAQPLYPDSITMPVGGPAFFTAEEMDRDCYGAPIGPNPVYDCTGVAPGQAFIHAEWNAPVYECGACQESYVPANADAEMAVAKVALEIDGVADSDKESVGGLVVRNFDSNDAPREMITIESPQVSAEGFIELTVSNSSKVKVFTAATGGTQLTFDGNDNRFEFSSLPISLYVEGVEPSNDMRDVTFSAKLVGNSSFVDQAKATVVSVEMPTVSFMGPTSTNNDKRGNYNTWTKAKTDNLGPRVYTDESPSIWDARFGWGIEASAVVKPAGFNYRNNDLKLERDLEGIDYFGSTPSPTKVFRATIPPGNDLSLPAFRDDNPMPNGVIYDLDAPGLHIDTADQNVIRRTRNNFKVFASITSGGKKIRVSPIRDCFIRFSMKQLDAPFGKNWALLSPVDFPTDNKAGYGTTKLSLNLQ